MKASNMNDIVFENRNKAYGAYDLRTNYPKRLRRSLIGAAFFMTLFLLGVFCLSQSQSEDEIVDNESIMLSEIIMPPPNNETPIIKAQQQPFQDIKTIKHVPPVPTEDNKATTDLAEQEDLKTAQIGTETKDGSVKQPENIVEVRGTSDVKVVEKVETVQPEELFIVVEQKAEYPGGSAAMLKFLKKHLKYPRAATESHIEGRVFLQFIVDKSGIISDIKILKSLGFGCDEEAMRVIRLMPVWKPAQQSGKLVKTRYNMAISFQLSK